MTVLFGHPTGNPNSHHAALAHWESGRLEAFCVPWMPTPRQLQLLKHMPGVRRWVDRFQRRCFEPLLNAPRIEGRCSEAFRLAQRMIFKRSLDPERLAYQANDWLMATMRHACRRPAVTAVHAYEDCSLGSFEEAKRLGKNCIYDMPIGYYPAWQEIEKRLIARYADWFPNQTLVTSRYVRPEQKQREMELADVVLAPSSFVMETVQRFSDKPVHLAPYGVDIRRWRPAEQAVPRSETLRCLFVGHVSVRKGFPVLHEAWTRAALPHARLDLVGAWHLAEARKADLPASISYLGHCSADELRAHYHAADLFVFPSFFEGQALVVGEALACGVPILTTPSSGAGDIVDDSCGRIVPTGDVDALVEQLRWFSEHRDVLATMRTAARSKAETLTWENYRARMNEAVAKYC